MVPNRIVPFAWPPNVLSLKTTCGILIFFFFLGGSEKKILLFFVLEKVIIKSLTVSSTGVYTVLPGRAPIISFLFRQMSTSATRKTCAGTAFVVTPSDRSRAGAKKDIP